MYDYNCPDCNEAKLQSDKNARKINEVIDQVNALIQVNNETVDFIEEKANEIIGEVAGREVNEVLGDLRTELDNTHSSLDNIENKNSWYVNIKSYLPENETDISNALLLAVESLNADGGTIILPCDITYTISSPVTITKNNVVIKSNSQYYNTTINVTSDVGINVLAYGFECEGIRFIGNGNEEGGIDATNIAIQVGDGIYENYDNFLFKKSQCYKFGKGLKINTRNFIIENSTFTWCLIGVEVEGLIFAGAVQGDRRNYRIADNRFHVCWGTALKLTGQVAHSEVIITNNQFDRCMDNITGYCEESLISNNLITVARGKGIYIDNTNILCGHLGTTVINNIITSWVGVEENSGDGIYLKAENSVIRGNKISRKNGYGICVIGNNNEITSNNVTDSSYFNSGEYSGIYIKGNFTLINNNISKNVKGTTQKYGLEITSDSQGCVMNGNLLNGSKGLTSELPPSTQGITYEGMTRSLRFGSGIPNNKEGQRGDYVINKIPTEMGETGSHYIIHGWQKVQDYTGGTSWVEVRTLTGR